jgi:protein-S-isoprenylcysteine O-methyltransferase Ste14
MIVSLGRFFFRYRNALFPCAIVLDFLPGPATFSSPLVAAVAGGAIAAAGEALRGLTVGLDYIVRGGRGGKVYADNLVTTGLFAHCRNPLYVGNLLIVTGLAVAADSLTALVVAPPLFLVAYHCIASAEEEFLLGKFGDEYRRYCERVPRFAIRLRGLAATLRDAQFHWRRLVVKEYGTLFALVAGIVVLTIGNYLEQSGYEAARGQIHGLAGLLAGAALLWLVTWYMKKTRRLAAD